MQRTLEWLYATKWELKSGKYVCNRLLRLRCKLLKIQYAWILSPCHMSLAKVFTGTMGMVVSVYASTNVSYSAPKKDTYLRLVPFRSKCDQLDVPFRKNGGVRSAIGSFDSPAWLMWKASPLMSWRHHDITKLTRHQNTFASHSCCFSCFYAFHQWWTTQGTQMYELVTQIILVLLFIS